MTIYLTTKRRLFFFGLILMNTMIPVVAVHAEQQPVYKNSNKSVDVRVKDLLKRMTPEEKASQLQAIWVKRAGFESPQGEFDPVKAKQFLEHGIGQIARPSENKGKDVATHKTPAQTLAYTFRYSRYIS
jgi:hypothetical protein